MQSINQLKGGDQPKMIVRVAVFDNQNKVLVMRRSVEDDHRGGEWDMPGGTVDPSEPVVTAAARETFEETGLTFTEDELQFIVCFQLYNRLWTGFKAVIPVAMTNQVIMSAEHTEYDWITPDAYSQLDVPEHHKALVYAATLLND